MASTSIVAHRTHFELTGMASGIQPLREASILKTAHDRADDCYVQGTHTPCMASILSLRLILVLPEMTFRCSSNGALETGDISRNCIHMNLQHGCELARYA